MLKKNDIINADIISMSSEGFGIAKHSDNELHDFVVFVKGAATGEKADVRIIKVLTSYAIAITERIYTPSPLRITPRCAAAGRCGGCAFGHIKYEEELRIKKKRSNRPAPQSLRYGYMRDKRRRSFPANIQISQQGADASVPSRQVRHVCEAFPYGHNCGQLRA